MKKLLYIVSTVALSIVVGCGQIDSGEAGFKTSFGKIDSEVLEPGLHFYNPIGGDLVKYSLRDQRFDGRLTTYTKDMQQADIDISAVIAPKKANIIDLHVKYGEQYARIICDPHIQTALKDVIGLWDAEKLVNGRELATKAIYDRLTELIKDYPITLRSISILNIDYSPVFEKAIEDKVVAAQEAIKAKNKTVQVEEESKQKIISAKAEAEAIKIRAEALAANKDIIMLNLIEKWDGKAPNTLSIGSESKLFLPAK